MSTEEANPLLGNRKPLIIGALILALLGIGLLFDARTQFSQALAWIEHQGTLGVLWYIGLYALACVLAIPGTILTLGGGAAYGLLWGTIYTSLASTLGAVLAFLVARYLARETLETRISRNDRFAAIDRAVGQEGWKIVLLTRLSPAFPFNFLNYGFGLTQVRLSHYILFSWIGMLPGTVLYVYLGTLAGDIARVNEGGRERSVFEWALYGLGLLATIAVTVLITRIAKDTLAETTEAE